MVKKMRVNEPSNETSSGIHVDCESSNHSQANTSRFRMINQDNKQVARESREAIHITINKLERNTGKWIS